MDIPAEKRAAVLENPNPSKAQIQFYATRWGEPAEFVATYFKCQQTHMRVCQFSPKAKPVKQMQAMPVAVEPVIWPLSERKAYLSDVGALVTQYCQAPKTIAQIPEAEINQLAERYKKTEKQVKSSLWNKINHGIYDPFK